MQRMTRPGLLLLWVLFLLGAALPAAQAQQEAAPPGTWFPIETLNGGLGDRPESMDLRTPQGAVEDFLDAIDDGRPEIAAHALDLSGVPDREQAERGPQLAAQLHSVLERRAIISWSSLLERPDALDAARSSSAAMAGEPRRSLLIGVLDADGRETAIRLNRVKPAEGDPVWVFSRRTVSQVPALYARYGPSWLERELPGWLRQETIFGARVFETVGLPMALILAILAGRITFVLLRRLSRTATGYWSGIALRAVRWPLITVVATTVVLFAALRVFSVTGPIASILTPLTLIGYVMAFLLFTLSILDTALDRIVTLDSDRLADPDNSTIRNQATLMTAARRVLIVLGVLVGLGIVLASANLFRSLGFSLLASAGAVTLILGFAARHVLGNILASLQIALNRSARIGDQVIYEDYFCTVERIHFTYVQLKTWDANRLVVPVSHFLSDSFENWSMVDGGRICSARITLHQQADIEALRQAFFDLCEAEEAVTVNESCKALVLEQDGFGVVTRFQFRVDDPNATWETECRMRERIVTEAQRIERETGRPMLPAGTLDEMAGD